MEMGLNRVRSLTISRGVPLDFRACRLLRVLDMEGCFEIDDGALTVICGLVLLKYLNLRDTNVCSIPSDIRNLSCLEMLDIRKMRVHRHQSERTVVNLPIDVFMLPRLAQLFGRFQLPQQLKSKKKRKTVERFFSEESRLHTLSGFVMESNSGYEHIVLHINRLRKVKIWCERSDNSGCLLMSSSLLRRFTGNNALESLSITFGDSDQDEEFMYYFNTMGNPDPCMLRSIKLRGKLPGTLPHFIASANNYLTELQLSGTGLPLEELSVLQTLGRLLYLKLAEDDDGFPGHIFIVETDGFPSLERLCFEAPNLPRLHIVEGAMPALTSLHLLCPESSDSESSFYEWEMKYDMSGIEYLVSLNELVLHSSVGDKELGFWKEKARMHKNRPWVTTMPSQKSPWGTCD